jgi:hypothetical protein
MKHLCLAPFNSRQVFSWMASKHILLLYDLMKQQQVSLYSEHACDKFLYNLQMNMRIVVVHVKCESTVLL